jgi:hypothetical protein
MEDLTKYFPLFEKFLFEMTYGSICSVEDINVEKFFDRTVMVAELDGVGYNIITREINSKLIINVTSYNNFWSYEKHILSKQFVSMFKKQFKSLDFDKCLVVINSIN